MPSQKEYDSLYIDVAHRISKMSKATRLHVGCVAVSNDNIISYGYNGTPSGFSNVCETSVDGKLVSVPEVIHGEMNCIFKLIKNGTTIKNIEIYLTDSPCLDCAKHLFQLGIKRLVYDREYRLTDGIDFLKKMGVEVIKHKTE